MPPGTAYRNFYPHRALIAQPRISAIPHVLRRIEDYPFLWHNRGTYEDGVKMKPRQILRSNIALMLFILSSFIVFALSVNVNVNLRRTVKLMEQSTQEFLLAAAGVEIIKLRYYVLSVSIAKAVIIPEKGEESLNVFENVKVINSAGDEVFARIIRKSGEGIIVMRFTSNAGNFIANLR
jgi:hypothetical protein